MNAHISYTPGDRYLATGPTVTVLSSDQDLVLRMWPVVRDGGDVAGVLAGALSGGFSSLADLVLLERGPERAEVLLRGELDLVAESSTSPTQSLDGRGVRTWRECSIPDATSVTVGCADADGVALPLACGVVQACGFRWTARPGPDGAPPPRGARPQRSASLGPVDASSEPSSPAAPVLPAPEPPAPEPPAPEPPAPEALSAPLQPPLVHGQPSAVPPPPPPAVPAPPPDPAPALAETRVGPGDDVDHLFESTIVRSPEDAAGRPDPDEDGDVAPGEGGRLGDHDGATILGGQLAALLRSGQHAAADVPPPPPPPASSWELVFSTGQIVPGDQPVVIGRKPQVDRVAGNQIPRLITVTGPNNDISRSHLEIRPDGTGLVATDLGSTNGTTLIGPSGQRPLTAHLAERIDAGVRLDLGDGITIDVRAAR